jgi:hypothetical protein
MHGSGGLALLALAAQAGCALMPAELNLSPIYRHRLDENGALLELDCLWPIVHWERTADGGTDFRIRPLFRHVTEGEEGKVSESAFLWPLGKTRSTEHWSSARLFPLFWHVRRSDDRGVEETDWYFLFPFFWGGTSADGKEDYLAVFPFYGNLPNWLTYDRWQFHFWPLHVRTEKDGKTGHYVLWPLIGWGGDGKGDVYWHRVLPFYSVAVDVERYERYSALWPFVHWADEHLGTRHPYSVFFLWPLFGTASGETHGGWTALWPFFQSYTTTGPVQSRELDVLWPIFRSHELHKEDYDLEQWWLWPLYGETKATDQRAWSFAWPLVWVREYVDPQGIDRQVWVLPFWWRLQRLRETGVDDDYGKLWPIVHATSRDDGSSEFNLLSPWPWRERNASDFHELFGWLWTIVHGEQRPGDQRIEFAANLFTSRKRGQRATASVPFLFSTESGPDGDRLFLFQFLPIRL